MAEEYSWWKYLTSPEPYTGYKTKDIAEAAKAMGSGVAGSIFGGTAAAAALPAIGNEGANQVLSDIQGRFQYQPEDKGGDLLQDIAESWPMQQFEKFGEYAGNRAAGFASIHGDEYKPLGYALGKTAPDVLGIAAGYPGAARLATKTSGLLDDAFKNPVSSRGMGGKQAGSMAGPKAKGADLEALAKAKQMKKSGASRVQTRKETGWHEQAPDQWVYEIPDTGFNLKNLQGRTLGDAFEHPEMFAAYPSLADVPFSAHELKGTTQGRYMPRDTKQHGVAVDPRADVESVGLHEGFAHGVQDIEGRAGGSNFGNAKTYKEVKLAEIQDQIELNTGDKLYKNRLKENRTKALGDRDFGGMGAIERSRLNSEARDMTQKEFGVDKLRKARQEMEDSGIQALYEQDWGEAEARMIQGRLEYIRAQRERGMPDEEIRQRLMEGDIEYDRPIASLFDTDKALQDYKAANNIGSTSEGSMMASRAETDAPVRKAKARNKSGQYVGAPKGVDSPQALGKVRKDYERSVVQGEAGADWYHDSSDFVKSVTNDPNKAQQMADVLAVTSARTPVDANLGHTIKGINQKAAGYPTKTGGFPNVMEPLIDDILSGNKPELGLKREPFAQNLSVAWAPEKGVRPVHDIWDGRAWGYKKDSGEPWDGGFSAPQHAWMDEQATLLDDRLNARKAGGRDDWNPLRSQAAAWTGKKIESGDIKNADDAAKHFGSYLDKYAANATHEQVPGEGTGQLAGMVDQPGEVRARYSDDLQATWLDERGRDKMYSGAGMATAPSRRGTGVYTPANTGVTEFNPMEVARPLVSRYQSKAKGEPVSLGDWDRDLLNVGESLRAFIDAQNAAAWNAELPGSPAKAQRGVALEMGKKPDPETVAKLQDLAMEKGFFASDTGSGVNLINDPYSAQGAKRGGVSLGKELKKGLGQQLKDISGVDPQRTAIESGFLDFEKEWTQGKGAATKKLFKTLDKNPAAAKAMDSPQVRQKALDNIRRDERYSDELGLPIRKDIQRTRKIFGEEGLDGLKKALDKNPDLLATIGTVIQETYV